MTEILPADPPGIARAAALLRAGDLVAFGTETVYGLGADATDARAVAAVFAAKGRPHFNPLICHYPDAEAAFAQVEANATARRLARAVWPGPLSLVLPRRADCPVALLAGAGLDTLAVRVPAHPTALALLRAVGRPVAAPSANRSGQISPTTARHVLDGLAGRIAAVLDSGPCPVGVESTVLDLCGAHPVLLRPGGVTIEAIEALLGPVMRGTPHTGSQAARSPGLQGSHYAPDAPVRLNAEAARADEALLAFGALPGRTPPDRAVTDGTRADNAGVVFQLSATRDLAEAAANLFIGLRALDAEVARKALAGIAVMPIPEHDLGLAINDRLRRAAAPRDHTGCGND